MSQNRIEVIMLSGVFNRISLYRFSKEEREATSTQLHRTLFGGVTQERFLLFARQVFAVARFLKKENSPQIGLFIEGGARSSPIARAVLTSAQTFDEIFQGIGNKELEADVSALQKQLKDLEELGKKEGSSVRDAFTIPLVQCMRQQTLDWFKKQSRLLQRALFTLEGKTVLFITEDIYRPSVAMLDPATAPLVAHLPVRYVFEDGELKSSEVLPIPHWPH